MQKFNSIVEAVAWNASNNPDKLCIIDEKEYTYDSFFNLIMRICVKLKNEKVLQGESILAECNQSAEFLGVSMACQLLGIIFVPMEKKVNEVSVGRYIKETNAKIIVSDKYNSEIGIKVISYIQLCEVTSAESVYNFPCESCVAEIPYMNSDYSEYLVKVLADDYSEEKWNWIKKLTGIHKLTYKLDSNINHGYNFYDYLIASSKTKNTK